jgi:hypothetical protein
VLREGTKKRGHGGSVGAGPSFLDGTTVTVVAAGRVPHTGDRGPCGRSPGLLADRGQHRAPSIPDLIVSATAELAGLTVLHPDKDFDVIATITGQPMERLETT